MRKLFLMLAILAITTTLSAQCKVLYIGDSITDGGWGNSGGTDAPSENRNHWDKNHIYGHSYMMLCASELEAQHPERQYTMYNRGISGDNIERLAKRWKKDALDLQPDVLSLFEGTNDVHYFLDSIAANQIPLAQAHFDIDRWEKGYRELLDASRQANPNLRLMLCSPFVAKVGRVGERADYELRAEIIHEMALRIKAMAKEYHATYVDFHTLFGKLTQQKEGASYWSWDGIHPTPAGHRKMADLWLKKY